jgi:hypothetical protein
MAGWFEKGVRRAQLCRDMDPEYDLGCPLATVVGVSGGSSHSDAHLVV